jgi:hypothetical protein
MCLCVWIHASAALTAEERAVISDAGNRTTIVIPIMSFCDIRIVPVQQKHILCSGGLGEWNREISFRLVRVTIVSVAKRMYMWNGDCRVMKDCCVCDRAGISRTVC